MRQSKQSSGYTVSTQEVSSYKNTVTYCFSSHGPNYQLTSSWASKKCNSGKPNPWELDNEATHPWGGKCEWVGEETRAANSVPISPLFLADCKTECSLNQWVCKPDGHQDNYEALAPPAGHKVTILWGRKWALVTRANKRTLFLQDSVAEGKWILELVHLSSTPSSATRWWSWVNYLTVLSFLSSAVKKKSC